MELYKQQILDYYKNIITHLNIRDEARRVYEASKDPEVLEGKLFEIFKIRQQQLDAEKGYQIAYSSLNL